MYRILALSEFYEWFELQTAKKQAQIQDRFYKILEYGHFGDTKRIGAKLAELRWKSGLRVYFSISKDDQGNLLVLLVGGNKNSQSKDITRAKKLLRDLSVKDIKR